MVKLILQRRVVPIYNRPFPWTWNLFVTSLKTDAQNLKIVLFELFPWWEELLIVCTVMLIFIFMAIAYMSGMMTLLAMPTHLLVKKILFDCIFG